jgi:hypothetical protein
MDAIKTYLETMFSALPKTAEVLRLKSELSVSMEEKYNELKAAGKSENEAVGTVISEFGNVEELLEEMGLSVAGAEERDEVYLTRDEAMQYLEVTKKSGFWIGVGVWLIMTGVALMLLIGGFSEVSVLNGLESLGELAGNLDVRGGVVVFILLMFIAGAVPLFIVHGMKLEPYDILEQKPVRLDSSTRAEIELLDKQYNPCFIWNIAGGVAVILFSVAMFVLFGVMVADEFKTVLLSLMLFMIGLAVYMFVTAGMFKDALEVLLGKGDYAEVHRFVRNKIGKMERIIGVAAAVFWPLVVAGYLAWSFISGDWGMTWVLWPICGLVFGAFSGAVGAYYSLGGGADK